MLSGRVAPVLASMAVVLAGCSQPTLADELRPLVEEAGVEPLVVPTQEAALVELGEALFFDPVLSGNMDTSCATCHHPALETGDARSLPVGTGGSGLGTERTLGTGRVPVPRNSPEVFNRGATAWNTMFWDGRLRIGPDGALVTPAGDAFPDIEMTVLAAQAMFPPTSPDEMRGAPGDFTVHGGSNELSELESTAFQEIWDGLMARLLAIPAYVDLFRPAYPGISVGNLGFEHAAIAIGAYEAEAFAFHDSPFDRFLAGDDDALEPAATRGATLFFGEAGCSQCHSGPLLTDQDFHVLGVPQIGPGKAPHEPDDLGRFRVTGHEADRYAFRTPPLRNVALTGPWMHDGAYTDLATVIRHHADPATTCAAYEAAPDVMAMAVPPEAALERLDDRLAAIPDLTDAQIADLIAFLEALTDPAAGDLSFLVPDTVPSGLAVDR